MLRFESYEEFLYWLYNLRRFGITYGVENVKVLLKELGNPQEKIKSVLITGSGGKGSTVEIVSKILEESGFKTGKFSKPHLSRFSERISINSKEISKQDVVDLGNEIANALERIKNRMEYYPTFFEVTYALSLLYFLREKTDICVYEVGIGGRFDATNTLNPLVSALTAVYLEHTKILGNTLKEIAWNKVGIARENGYFVSANLQDEAKYVVMDECKKLNCKLFFVSDKDYAEVKFRKIISNLKQNVFDYYGIEINLKEANLSLLGEHQLSNASVAICMCELLKNYDYEVTDSKIRKALNEVSWPGRLEFIEKQGIKFILDCAKDPTAMKVLCDFLSRNLNSKPLAIVSISSDKDYKSMIDSLTKLTDRIIFTKHNVMGRAIKPEILKEYAINSLERNDVREIGSVEEALKYAIEVSKKGEYVLVTGSVFTVGEARRYLLNEDYDKIVVSDPLP